VGKLNANSLKRQFYGLLVVAFFLLGLYLLWANPTAMLWLMVGLSAIFFFSFSFYAVVASQVADKVPPTPKKWPSVSIIVPCFNSKATIHEAIAHIKAMRYAGEKEIIVIDDSSTDGSPEMAEKMGVRVVRRQGERGKARALNHGMRLAKGEIVVAIDSDTYPPADALEKMIPYFYTGPKVGAVTVFITVANAKNALQRMQQLEYYSAFGFVAKTMGKINGLMVTPGPMSAYKRAALLEMGGFDEENMTEDMEIGLKLHQHGYSIECCTETHVPTEVPNTLKKLYVQRVRWYRGTMYNLKLYFHMFLNHKYSDFGLFSYPTTTIYVATTMLLWTIISFNLLSNAASALDFAAAWLRIGELPVLHADSFLLVNSVTIFLLASIVVWWYFLLRSVRMIGAKLGLHHAIPAILIMLFYPTLNSFFYFASLYKEARGSEFKWS